MIPAGGFVVITTRKDRGFSFWLRRAAGRLGARPCRDWSESAAGCGRSGWLSKSGWNWRVDRLGCGRSALYDWLATFAPRG